MRQFVVAIALLMLCGGIIHPVSVVAGGEVTSALIERLDGAYEANPSNQALEHVFVGNWTYRLVQNTDLVSDMQDKKVFNHTLPAPPISDQLITGYCWIYSGFNILRPAAQDTFKLKGLQFSVAHLQFYDYIEKDNYFLEFVIETRKQPATDPELVAVFADPIPDGGWFQWYANLANKYGLVPEKVRPRQKHTTNTKGLSRILNQCARRDGYLLRQMAAEHASERKLRAAKEEMLSQTYRLLALHLGGPALKPNESFSWRYKDDDGEIRELTHTPMSFYLACGMDLTEFVSLFNHPLHPYRTHIAFRYTSNIHGAKPTSFVNLPIDELMHYSEIALKNSATVFTALDMQLEVDREHGLMALDVRDWSILGMENMRLPKKDAILMRATSPGHAVTLTGIDTTATGDVNQWRVDNVWGTDQGWSGRYTMTNPWFEQYVFAVTIHQDLLSEEILKIYEQPPYMVMANDPLRGPLH